MPNNKAQSPAKRNMAKKSVICCQKCKTKEAAKPAEAEPKTAEPKTAEPKPAESKPAEATVDCEPITKQPKPKKPEEKVKCVHPAFYRSGQEQREYLEHEVVPILMEGMVALARDQPTDPISYLEKFWLQEEHKCDIPVPNDLL